jgi:RNA polymerase sigma-70 factor, ECF subfamily
MIPDERDRAGRARQPSVRDCRRRRERRHVNGVVSLLTDDALLTMPPQPLEYQGEQAIAAFLRHRTELRGAALRVVSTRANNQPAFGC